MSMVKEATEPTKRPELLQHAKIQQPSGTRFQTESKNGLSYDNASSMQHSSPPTPTSIKTSLSTSPVVGNYIDSSSLFSFESGLVLSGSSGCCSLSNSPSSSSSSNSFLTPQCLENSCNKLLTNSNNNLCVNTFPYLGDSFSGTCQLNAALSTTVNGDLDAANKMSKSLKDSSRQTETFPNTSKSQQRQSNDDESGQILVVERVNNQNSQQSAAESISLNSEDAGTLQLAVELTMMNFNQISSPKPDILPTLSPTSSTSNDFQHPQSHNIHHSALETKQLYSSVGNSYHLRTKVFVQTQSQVALINQNFLSEPNKDPIPSSIPNTNLTTNSSTTDAKKSQNMTECVPVPSSEHVAEIVGRQGCKIKALRAKTNTYIKTPVRNEEPVFVVTGRKEDVAKAKREILSAAEHFTLIRATRRTNDGVSGCSSNLSLYENVSCNSQLVSLGKNAISSTSAPPGQITTQVRVPYRVVGLVVGPKGNTIKHIQHETQTYIVTPSRDKEPIFEVTGMPNNVLMARKQIEAHIATRTGNLLTIPASSSPPPPPPPPPPTAGTLNRLDENLAINHCSSFLSLNSLNQILNDDLHSEILSSIYKNGISTALDYNQIGDCILNTASKCNHSNSLNSYLKNNLDSSISSVNCIQREMIIRAGSTCNDNTQQTNNELINNIVDPDTAIATQFAYEQNKILPHISNYAHRMKNLQTVSKSFNTVENANNCPVDLANQHINLNANTLLTRSCSSASSTASSSKSFNNNGSCNSKHFVSALNGAGPSPQTTIATSATSGGIVNSDAIDIDEGISESPLYSWGLPNTVAALTNSYCSPTSTSISSTDSLIGEHIKTSNLQHPIQISPKIKLLEKLKRKTCWMCHEKDVLATLMPCGHKIFCSLCANRLCLQNDSSCPVCSTQIFQAISVH